MKTKTTASAKQQSIPVKDLKPRKNPKGGASISPSHGKIKSPGISDQAAGGILTSY